MTTNRDPHSSDIAQAAWSISTVCGVFLPAIILFCMGAVTDITVPGIYMDAVNPDYMIVHLLSPAGIHSAIWALPGTVLFNRFPIIGQIYHGALPFYIGLPFYALFGTSVVGVRLTNMVFGLLVLVGSGVFMRAAGVRRVICCLCLMLLALDPGFLFSFRIQFYITLLPIAALLLSAALVEVWRDAPTRRLILLSGILAGLSCYGYFIFGFLVPAVAILALYHWHRLPGMLVLFWPAGFLVGVSPYIIGFLSMLIATGGPHGFIQLVLNDLRQLQVESSPLSLMQRIHFFFYLLQGTVTDVGPSSMMLHAVTPLEIPSWKLALLLVVPGLAVLSGLTRLRHIIGLLVIFGMILGFLLLVLVFGGRLWFQHSAFLLPLLYVGLALGIERIALCVARSYRLGVGLACVLILTPFLVANASDRQAVFLQLETTGGVGLSSDAIDRFAQDTLRQNPNVHVFFPDWGMFMQFAMLTRGEVPYSTEFSPTVAQTTLCGGIGAVLVTMASYPPERLQQWIKAVGWPSKTEVYTQRDGKPVFFVTHWSAAGHPGGKCS